MDSESSLLSLTTAGSSMNAALGNVSAGGMGTPEFDVIQKGNALVHLLLTSPEVMQEESHCRSSRSTSPVVNKGASTKAWAVPSRRFATDPDEQRRSLSR